MDTKTPKTKVCTKCGKRKALGNFYAKNGGRYGVTGRCKVCLVQDVCKYEHANRKQVNAKHYRSRRNNPVAWNEKRKMWRKANPDKYRASARQRETNSREELDDRYIAKKTWKQGE